EEEFMKAQILYEMVLPYYKGKKEAEEMYFKFAYTYYNLEDYMLAAHYFKSYANSFTNSTHREEALYMAAFSEYQMSPNYQLDQTQTNKAIDDFQLFVNTFPSSDKVEQCNQLMDKLREKLERKAFEQGHLYYKLGKYISAIVSFENMLKDFPETKREEQVRFLILKSSFNYAKNSIFEKKLERLNDTIGKYKEFAKRFPESKYIKEANKINSYSLTEINKIKNGYKI
ncbi:MAG TPA: outer membrane protein assembly factor BamD, partial [Saprospiraceae bacterium]|nr:outer membrane protein assembly factor BamD [Saprospiraceae bacterium]